MAEKTDLTSNEIAIKEGAIITFNLADIKIKAGTNGAGGIDGTVVITLEGRTAVNKVQIGSGPITFDSCGVLDKNIPNIVNSGSIGTLTLVIDASTPPIITLSGGAINLNTNIIKGRQGTP